MAPEYPTIPLSCRLTYLAEGAANVVYRMHVPEYESARTEGDEGDNRFRAATPPPTELELWQLQDEDEVQEVPVSAMGSVIRIRKDVPFVTLAGDAVRDYEDHIAPWFAADQVVAPRQMLLSDELVQRQNQCLKNAELSGTRPEKRHGTYLGRQQYCTMLPDMFYWEHEEGTTFELKPKWLCQSPNAPVQARRCRTCALRAMRRASSSQASTNKDFCPLSLMSTDMEEVGMALSSGLGIHSASWEPERWQKLVEAIRTSSLLSSLRSAQEKLDPEGVIGVEQASTNLLTAMTIRDCTIFIRIPFEASGKCELRAGDLDLKSPDKLNYWKSVEEKLIDGGWYTSEEPECCLLERKNGVAHNR